MMKVPKGMKKLSTESKSSMISEYKHDPRPEIDLGVKDLPEIESWETGKEYTLSVKVKMEKYHEKEENGKVEKRGCLRVVAIGVKE